MPVKTVQITNLLYGQWQEKRKEFPMTNKRNIKYSILNSTNNFNIFGDDVSDRGATIPTEIIDSILESRLSDQYNNEYFQPSISEIALSAELYDEVFR